MPKLEVTAAEIRYAKRTYKFGETFEASEKDAKILKAIHKAKDAAPDVPKTQRAPRRAAAAETRVMTAEQSSTESGPSRSQGYLRSDMRAED